MNDISRAMEKKRAEKAKHRYAVGAESGADWGLTLIYQALTAYEKQFGPVDIYHGNRGER